MARIGTVKITSEDGEPQYVEAVEVIDPETGLIKYVVPIGRVLDDGDSISIEYTETITLD